MSLISLWHSSKESLQDKYINQIIAFAGDGKLLDKSETSSEFRTFLSLVPSDLLARFASECLTTKFEQSGFALQDVVNQIGRRLSFKVEDGLYRGKPGLVGCDGLWHSETGHDLVVEVKTTDAYRIDLEVIAAYRTALIKGGEISDKQSSTLIVVGRQDTGDLEAQIRGSRHGWDIRLISVDALVRLMMLKETVDDPAIINKIIGILIPQEFTRVDGIIDLVFQTAEEVTFSSSDKDAEDLYEEVPATDATAVQAKVQPVEFHKACAAKISKYLKVDLIKRTKSTYVAPDETVAVSCAVSKEHSNNNRNTFWFAFHPSQQEYLTKVAKGYAAFGCGSADRVFIFPTEEFYKWLPDIGSTTTKEGRSYWHIKLRYQDEKWYLLRKAGKGHLDVSGFLI